jgi:hypothetical protein
VRILKDASLYTATSSAGIALVDAIKTETGAKLVEFVSAVAAATTANATATATATPTTAT